MTSGAHVANHASLSQGQIDFALQGILEYQCDFIESIGSDCRPANAVVEAFLNPSACGIRVYTGLSQNNDRYRLTISETSTGVVIWQGGWVQGGVPPILSVSQTRDKYGDPVPGQPFYSGTEYTILLETDGPCGDSDADMVSFIADLQCNFLEAPQPDLPHVFFTGQTPNQVSFTVDAEPGEEYIVALSDDITGNYLDVANGISSDAGSNNYSLDISNLLIGQPFSVTVVDNYGRLIVARSAKQH